MIPGLNPKHTKYAFSLYSLLYYIRHFVEKKDKNTQKMPDLTHINFLSFSYSRWSKNVGTIVQQIIDKDVKIWVKA